jgi:hypothetical protein
MMRAALAVAYWLLLQFGMEAINALLRRETWQMALTVGVGLWSL